MLTGKLQNIFSKVVDFTQEKLKLIFEGSNHETQGSTYVPTSRQAVRPNTVAFEQRTLKQDLPAFFNKALRRANKYVIKKKGKRLSQRDYYRKAIRRLANGDLSTDNLILLASYTYLLTKADRDNS